jgi:hypothetical protein
MVMTITRLAAVLRPGPRSLAPALAVLALGVAGCGSDIEKTIPPENADAMLAQLDQIESSTQNGDCEIAQNGVLQLREQAGMLPKEVGAETKETLFELVDNLEGLVESQCEQPATGATGPETTTEPPTETPTTSTTTSTEEEVAPPEQEDEEGDGPDPGNSDNAPPGPEGNPNQDDSGSGDDGTGSGGIGDG